MNIVSALRKERARVEKQLEGLDAAIAALGGHKKRKMSAAVRNKIAKTQRAKWAKRRNNTKPSK
jgi:hypothetical protein